MEARLLTALGTICLCLSAASIPEFAVATAPAADWPQWRGPARDGTSRERGLLRQWPKEGPPLAWLCGRHRRRLLDAGRRP